MNTPAPAPFIPYTLTPGTFTAEFEAAHGRELILAAAHLPRVSARSAAGAASLLAEPIRETYEANWTNPADAEDRAAALASFRRGLPALSPERAEYYLMLVAYAVHTEMKFQADPGYIADPDHDFELLVEVSDFQDGDDLAGAGTQENIERLVTLADTAAAYAFSENENAALDARHEGRKAA